LDLKQFRDGGQNEIVVSANVHQIPHAVEGVSMASILRTLLQDVLAQRLDFSCRPFALAGNAHRRKPFRNLRDVHEVAKQALDNFPARAASVRIDGTIDKNGIREENGVAPCRPGGHVKPWNR
jgi:hypothetical protein